MSTRTPILPLRQPGTCDEFGVMPSAALRAGKDIWLYTVGWQGGPAGPYRNAMRLAVRPRYAAPNENFVPVVLTSSFDSIARLPF
jgi:hypothetical protein